MLEANSKSQHSNIDKLAGFIIRKVNHFSFVHLTTLFGPQKRETGSEMKL